LNDPLIEEEEKVSEEEKWLKNEINLFRKKFEEAMDDDFNTAQALGHIFELTRNINKFLDQKEKLRKDGKKVLRYAMEALKEKGKILNLFQRKAEEVVIVGVANITIPSIRIQGEGKVLTISTDKILKKIKERNAERANKKWEEADRIRKELEEYGILLEDRPDGTVWRVKR